MKNVFLIFSGVYDFFLGGFVVVSSIVGVCVPDSWCDEPVLVVSWTGCFELLKRFGLG